MFLPIMRGTLNLPAARDPEVLERLDPSGTLNLCLRYQQHLALCANAVAADQNQIITKVREVSAFVASSKKFKKMCVKHRVIYLSINISCRLILKLNGL